MARYLVLERSFIHSVLVEAGTEIEYSGIPDGNLQPLDDEGKAAAETRVAEVARKRAKDEAHARFVERFKKGGGIDDLI